MRTITGLMISTQPIPNAIEIYGIEMDELIVAACDDYKDILITSGFESVEECREYCEMMRTSLGLPKDAVDIDFSEHPKLSLVK